MLDGRSHLGSLLLACAVSLSAACQRLPETDDDDGPASASSAPTSSGGGTFAGTFVPDSADDTGRDADDTPTGCDPVAQTGCPSSEKCTIVRMSEELAYGCVDDASTLQPLDPCTPQLSDGMDGCPPKTVCLADESGSGLCVSHCGSDGDCDSGICLDDPLEGVPFCATECSPFEDACPAPLQCRRNDIRFACKFASDADVGGAGSACSPTEDTGCAEGFTCLPGALVPECINPDCCASLCDLTEPDSCSAPAVCNQLIEAPAPGFETIGACFVPA